MNRFVLLLICATMLNGCGKQYDPSSLSVDWTRAPDSIWVGRSFWANRLQDWRVSSGRLECVEGRAAKPYRTAHILNRRFSTGDGTATLSVETGLINNNDTVSPYGATGFLIGAAPSLDYRGAALVHHTPGDDGGLLVTVDTSGTIHIQDFSQPDTPEIASSPQAKAFLPERTRIVLKVTSSSNLTTIHCTMFDADEEFLLNELKTDDIDSSRLRGSMALVSHPGTGETGARFWFNHLLVSGNLMELHDDRTCGPIISAQHTLSRGVLSMTAQFMPVNTDMGPVAHLQLKTGTQWDTVASSRIFVPGYTAHFRTVDWTDNQDTPYRVLWETRTTDGHQVSYTYEGTVRSDPVDKEEIVVAGFTGNHNASHPGAERGIPWNRAGVWFPHDDLMENLVKHKPDFLFFSGDQVYEGDSPTMAIKEPVEELMLDYLYKWYLWCWAWGEIARDIPCVCIPDDHDVYQGNLWGAGGRKTDEDNKGGYVMPAEFVKMVERTQTGNLPEPYDPRPVEQDIGVYFTDIVYGRISFAVVEDRKFKSGCNGLVPPTTSGRPDHVIDPGFDPATADVPGAVLLGDRQLRFLRDWAGDWRGADMKMCLSQTVWANVATNHGPNLMRLIADYDSDGWPQSGRNRALHELRKGFSFMLCGDQHLATIVHHGIDDYNDAGWSFCVPSIANFYLRAWWPQSTGRNRVDGMPEYTGEFRDGFGNRVTMWAATNPGETMGVEPAGLHDQKPGYGIVRCNKNDRTFTMECWPRFADPANGDGGQYEGWPKTVKMEDNYARMPVGYLPEITVTGMNNPVVQIVNEKDGEIVYTLRIRGTQWVPFVFELVSYTVRVGNPDTQDMKEIQGITVDSQGNRTLEIPFNR